MATPRVTAAVKAVVLVLLAALSVTWTAALVTVGTGVPAVEEGEPGLLPGGASVPTEAIEAPASVSRGDAMSAGSAAQAIATASTNGIPSAALAAYQRAETVINAADGTCNMSWQLIAAIGRVESDHGRFGGNSLDDEGVAKPGIYGVALDGTGGTAIIGDTDGGELDRDDRFDRAIGPMQFIPSTWSVVGVDADDDGRRNPQDIDDAALASAVYLCSGADDLAEEAGRRAAVFRYNHSERYVDLVLTIMDAYLEGDYTSVPNDTVAGGQLVPTGVTASPRTTPRPDPTPEDPGPDPGTPSAIPTPAPSPTPSATPSTTPTATPTPTPSPTQSQPTPRPSSSPKPTTPAPTVPVPTPTLPVPTPTLILTLAQAIEECLSRGLVDDPLDDDDAFDRCVVDLTT